MGSDFALHARRRCELHALLGAATRNPILPITIRAVTKVMKVMRKLFEAIGPSDNTYTTSWLRRFLDPCLNATPTRRWTR